METVSLKDREILRELASRKAELSHSARNAEILKMWAKQAEGVRDLPTVRLLFSNFRGEVIGSRMRCEGETARRLEAELLSSMVGRELFDDDTPVSDTFDVKLFQRVSPFGTEPRRIFAKDSIGYHIEPLTDDIEADLDLFRNGSFSVDLAGTQAFCAQANDVFGDLLPAQITQSSLIGQVTNPLVALIGME